MSTSRIRLAAIPFAVAALAAAVPVASAGTTRSTAPALEQLTPGSAFTCPSFGRLVGDFPSPACAELATL
ncbi:MAG: hypothetical protein QOE36_927 [Gaiellaceae bacterium]|jgi:hypothetical protein|nr:hypothetical protein [Gaiellaceae bacterium]